MNSEQFKFGMKITISIAVVIFCLIIGMLIFVLNTSHAEPNLYAEIFSDKNKENTLDITEISLEAKGIEKKEFENYLAMFSNLIYTGYYKDFELTNEELKNTQMLNVAVNLLNVFYFYEDKNETNATVYDAEKVHNVIKEMAGTYVHQKLDVKTLYTYDEAQNAYIPQIQNNSNCIVVNIDELLKEEDKIDVVYKVIFPNNEEMAKYLEGKSVDLETSTVKATILENSDYEYSKYYINSIKQISKETVKYN